jgi:hypothetical protein
MPLRDPRRAPGAEAVLYNYLLPHKALALRLAMANLEEAASTVSVERSQLVHRTWIPRKCRRERSFRKQEGEPVLWITLKARPQRDLAALP